MQIGITIAQRTESGLQAHPLFFYKLQMILNCLTIPSNNDSRSLPSILRLAKDKKVCVLLGPDPRHARPRTIPAPCRQRSAKPNPRDRKATAYCFPGEAKQLSRKISKVD